MPSNKQTKKEESGLGFNSALKKSIAEGLASVVGTKTVAAVDFYLDPDIAVKDIAAYSRSLEKMFTVGSKLIEDRCAQSLFANLKIKFEPKENFRLDDYVQEARHKWLVGDSFVGSN